MKLLPLIGPKENTIELPHVLDKRYSLGTNRAVALCGRSVQDAVTKGKTRYEVRDLNTIGLIDEITCGLCLQAARNVA